MHYHNITTDDMLNGEGLRVVLWVAGCEHHCPGCHNPVTWNEQGGALFDETAKEEIFAELAHDYIHGITYSGGDPLFPGNRREIAALAKEIRERFPQKSQWLYTGYTWEEIMQMEHNDVLECLDVVVEGRYAETERDVNLPWRGSANQRVISLNCGRIKGKSKLYHASNISGLRVLTPHISTHGKEYVYAVNSRVLAMLFGTPKDDFDLLTDVEHEKIVVYECYPDALKKVYNGKQCSVYEVSADGFLHGITGWDAELVNPKPVSVIQEERVDDIFVRIMEAANTGELVIHHYADNKEYQSFLCDELQERIQAFGMTEEDMDTDPRFLRYHKKLFHQSNEGERKCRE